MLSRALQGALKAKMPPPSSAVGAAARIDTTSKAPGATPSKPINPFLPALDIDSIAPSSAPARFAKGLPASGARASATPFRFEAARSPPPIPKGIASGQQPPGLSAAASIPARTEPTSSETPQGRPQAQTSHRLPQALQLAAKEAAERGFALPGGYLDALAVARFLRERSPTLPPFDPKALSQWFSDIGLDSAVDLPGRLYGDRGPSLLKVEGFAAEVEVPAITPGARFAFLRLLLTGDWLPVKTIRQLLSESKDPLLLVKSPSYWLDEEGIRKNVSRRVVDEDVCVRLSPALRDLLAEPVKADSSTEAQATASSTTPALPQLPQQATADAVASSDAEISPPEPSFALPFEPSGFPTSDLLAAAADAVDLPAKLLEFLPQVAKDAAAKGYALTKEHLDAHAVADMLLRRANLAGLFVAPYSANQLPKWFRKHELSSSVEFSGRLYGEHGPILLKVKGVGGYEVPAMTPEAREAFFRLVITTHESPENASSVKNGGWLPVQILKRALAASTDPLLSVKSLTYWLDANGISRRVEEDRVGKERCVRIRIAGPARDSPAATAGVKPALPAATAGKPAMSAAKSKDAVAVASSPPPKRPQPQVAKSTAFSYVYPKRHVDTASVSPAAQALESSSPLPPAYEPPAVPLDNPKLDKFFADLGFASEAELTEQAKVTVKGDAEVAPMTPEAREAFLRLVFSAVYQSLDNTESVRDGGWIPVQSIKRALSTSTDPLLGVKTVTYWLDDGEVSKAIEGKRVLGERCIRLTRTVRDSVAAAMGIKPVLPAASLEDVSALPSSDLLEEASEAVEAGAQAAESSLSASLPELLQQAAKDAASYGHAFPNGHLDAISVARSLRTLAPSLPPHDAVQPINTEALETWFAGIGLEAEVELPGPLYGDRGGPEQLKVKGMAPLGAMPMSQQARQAFLQFLSAAVQESGEPWISVESLSESFSSPEVFFPVKVLDYWLYDEGISKALEFKQADGKSYVRLASSVPDSVATTASSGESSTESASESTPPPAPAPVTMSDVVFSGLEEASSASVPAPSVEGLDLLPAALPVPSEAPSSAADAPDAPQRLLELLPQAAMDAAAKGCAFTNGNLDALSVVHCLRRLNPSLPAFNAAALPQWFADIGLGSEVEFPGRLYDERGPEQLRVKGMAALEVPPITPEQKQAFFRFLNSVAHASREWVPLKTAGRLLSGNRDPLLPVKFLGYWLYDEEVLKAVEMKQVDGEWAVRLVPLVRRSLVAAAKEAATPPAASIAPSADIAPSSPTAGSETSSTVSESASPLSAPADVALAPQAGSGSAAVDDEPVLPSLLATPPATPLKNAPALVTPSKDSAAMPRSSKASQGRARSPKGSTAPSEGSPTLATPDLLRRVASEAAGQGYAFPDGSLDAFVVAQNLRGRKPSLPPFDPAALPKWFADIGLAAFVDVPGLLYGNCGPEVIKVKGMADFGVPPIGFEARKAFVRFLYTAIYESPANAALVKYGDWISVKAAARLLLNKRDPLLPVKSIRYWLYEEKVQKALELRLVENETCVRLTAVARDSLAAATGRQSLVSSGDSMDSAFSRPRLLQQAATDAAAIGYVFHGGYFDALKVISNLQKLNPSLPPADSTALPQWFANIGLASLVELPGHLYGNHGPLLLKVKGMADFEVPPMTQEAREAFLRFLYAVIYESPANAASIKYGHWISKAVLVRILSKSKDPLLRVKNVGYWVQEPEVEKSLEQRVVDGEKCIRLSPSVTASFAAGKSLVLGAAETGASSLPRLLQQAATDAAAIGYVFQNSYFDAFAVAGNLRTLDPSLPPADSSALPQWFVDIGLGSEVEFLGNLYGDQGPFLLKVKGMADFEVPPITQEAREAFLRFLYAVIYESPANAASIKYGHWMPERIAERLLSKSKDPLLRVKSIRYWSQEPEIWKSVETRVVDAEKCLSLRRAARDSVPVASGSKRFVSADGGDAAPSLPQLLQQAAEQAASYGYAFDDGRVDPLSVASTLRRLAPSLPSFDVDAPSKWFGDIGLASFVEVCGPLYGDHGPEAIKVKGMADFKVPPMSPEARTAFLRLLYTSIYENRAYAEFIKCGHWIPVEKLRRILSGKTDPLLRVKSLLYWLQEDEISKVTHTCPMDDEICVRLIPAAVEYFAAATDGKPVSPADLALPSFTKLLQQAAADAAGRGYAFGGGHLDAASVAVCLRNLVPSLKSPFVTTLPKWFAEVGLGSEVEFCGPLYGDRGPERLKVKGMAPVEVPPMTAEARDAFLRFLYACIYQSPAHAPLVKSGHWLPVERVRRLLAKLPEPLLRVKSEWYWLYDEEVSKGVQFWTINEAQYVRLKPETKASLDAAAATNPVVLPILPVTEDSDDSPL